MYEKHSIDEHMFDRLVDGELSPAERRELLAGLDNQPDGWRRCALSFLEAQSWREGMGQLVHEAADVAPTSNANPTHTPANVAHLSVGTRSAARGFAWLAVAASLFVAFTLGTVVRQRSDSMPMADGGAAKPGVQIADVVPPPAAGSPGATSAADALTLFVRDDTGRTRPLRVPLVDAGDLQRQLGLQFQSGVPAHVRSQLQTRGFDVHSKQRYAPLWLENGRPMFVPVEDTRIVPVSQNVY